MLDKPLAVCMPVEAHLRTQGQLHGPLRVIKPRVNVSLLWVANSFCLR
jgi:hypothetical protein